jgi:hypothetical protein
MLRKLTLALALLIAACGTEEEPEAPAKPVLKGNWGGSVDGVTFTLTLSQSGENVSGNGQIQGDGGGGAISVDGTNVHPNVALTLKSSGYYDINYSSRFQDSKTVYGTVNGSGFTGESLTLTKR